MIARLPISALAVVLATLSATVPASARAQAAARPVPPAHPVAATPPVLSALPAAATPPAPVAPPAAATPPAPATPAVPPAAEPALVQEESSEAKVPEPKIEHLVTEDSQVRIEETRVRGVTTRVVVKSKIRGMGSYGIQPRDPGRYPQDDYSAGLPTLNFGF